MVNNFSKLFLAAEILGQAVGTAADLMTLHQYGFADIRVYQKNFFSDTVVALFPSPDTVLVKRMVFKLLPQNWILVRSVLMASS